MKSVKLSKLIKIIYFVFYIDSYLIISVINYILFIVADNSSASFPAQRTSKASIFCNSSRFTPLSSREIAGKNFAFQTTSSSV